MNRTLRAHLPHRTLVPKQSLPFVAKYPSIPRSDISAGHIASLLRWIGALHALHVDRAGSPELENRAMRALNHAHIFDIPM